VFHLNLITFFKKEHF